tara:strand:+ start:124 stop:1287 length:1164 start_codon:yes stop_codon:yes gene_type:complete
MKKIYCDISATTPVNEKVIDLMSSIQGNVFGNPSSVHKYGQESHVIIEKARIETAKALNCHQEEIIFTASGTEANNIALEGIVDSNHHIISTTYEHPSVMNVIKNLEKKGASLTLLKPTKDGKVDPKIIENEISENTKVITVMFANNELGSINNIKEISKITQKHNIILHVDAVQCVGKIPIDLNELKIDMMSLSAHKFYGPKGVGALFIRKGINLKTILNGGGQELNLRPGTENIAGIAGLGLAISLAYDHIKENISYVKKLEQLFIKELDNYKINYILHIKDRLPGVLAIGFPGIDGQSLLISLDLKGIAVSFGSACSSGTTKASQILLDAGINENLAKSTLRISFGKIHTEDDVKYVAEQLSITLKRLGKKTYFGDDLGLDDFA